MQLSEKNQDVIIIGGGLSGLAAATMIARAGRRVRLFEQAHALGGRARTKEQNGFYLNLGPHALYRSGQANKILRELGVEPVGRVPSVSGAYAVRRGVKHTFPAGLVSMLTTSLFGLSAKLEAARLLASLQKIETSQLMGVSVREWLDGQISDQVVKEFLMAAFRVATYTNAPELMSAGAALEQLQMAFDKSVLYLDGGWQTLVDHLSRLAADAGVVIETGTKIEAVERDAAGAVRGARLADGRSFLSSAVVIASSPQVAVSLLERGRETSLARRADELVAVRAACLDVSLKYLPMPKVTFALGIDRPLYLSVHSATARLAPEGGALIHVAKYLPPGHTESPDEDRRELEGLLDLVQPGWREAVVNSRFLPDMIVMNAIATAGIKGTKGRPTPEVSDVPGLFIAGDWVGPEGLLADASLASAKQAAQIIASKQKAFVAA
ncbi:MAG TPA: NAD(P)/FAD-dependent oxidoreductase [Blastocatellia bacterium]|nr:NAD(P)/FAD-dependent oxidoreductase [Blastocatellia bacterium]